MPQTVRVCLSLAEVCSPPLPQPENSSARAVVAAVAAAVRVVGYMEGSSSCAERRSGWRVHRSAALWPAACDLPDRFRVSGLGTGLKGVL
jgi:hypothetical protein